MFYLTRTVGIEMECIHGFYAEPFTTALRALLPNVQRMGYGHSNGRTWDIKTDGSCGWEVASPALRFTTDASGAPELPELRTVCRLLNDAQYNARVDRTCGLHVHVDVSDFTREQTQRLIALWLRYEPFYFQMVPAARRANRYCKAMRTTSWTADTAMNAPTRAAVARALTASTDATFKRELGMLASDRYYSMNLTHLWLSGRVEFRLHSGTLNYGKIRQWVLWLMALVERAKMEPEVRRGVAKPMPADAVLAGRGGPGTWNVATALGVTAATHGAVFTQMVEFANARRAQFADGARRTTARPASAVVERGEGAV